jgi:serine/threonine protein kinase
MLGQVLAGRYELQERLSQNTGKSTFLARDLQAQELVVLKLLSFSIDFNWEDLKLFEREAKTLKSLSHPATPRYLNSFELDLGNVKCFATVQTYIAGESLDKCLKNGRVFTELEVKQLAKSLLEILIYLHGCQPPVIHRDIKPSNILLTNRSGNSVGDVYLVDFGSVQTVAAREGVSPAREALKELQKLESPLVIRDSKKSLMELLANLLGVELSQIKMLTL